MRRHKTTQLEPSYRIIRANDSCVVLKARRSLGSLRCCGPVVVAMTMFAGFALFIVMQGYEAPGLSNTYQCIPLGVGIVALGLTVVNLLELLHHEDVVFDNVRNEVAHRDNFVLGLIRWARWRVPFSRIYAVGLRKIGESSWSAPIWSVHLLLRDGQNIRLDRASDREKMFALANYLASYLRVDILE